MTIVRIVDLDTGHLGDVLTLNSLAVPATSHLEPQELDRLIAMSQYSLVALDDSDHVAGFCITFLPGVDYQSLNYRWFSERYPQFSYLDRIVVRDDLRGSGIGAALYAELEQRINGTIPVLCCEVNLKPLNEGSLRFHHRIGFVEVGQQDTDGGKKRVSLLVKRLG